MSPVTSRNHCICTHWNSFDLFTIYLRLYLPLPLCRLIMRFFPQALFGVFLGGDMFVLSTMATKVKVTKSMLHTLDYQNSGRRQCSQHKIPFICSLIVGISDTIPGLAVDLLSRWVWPLRSELYESKGTTACAVASVCTVCLVTNPWTKVN